MRPLAPLDSTPLVPFRSVVRARAGSGSALLAPASAYLCRAPGVKPRPGLLFCSGAGHLVPGLLIAE
jgi:hypothetical protein